MRLKPKLRMVSGVGREATLIDNAKWERIESAYGHQLSPPVRRCICDATQRFIRIADLEKKAELLETAKDRLSELQKVAGDFTSEVVGQLRGSDETLYGLRLIEEHFDDPRVPEHANKLEYIAGIMTSLTLACRSAEDNLIADNSLGMRHGMAWNAWIRALTAIAPEHKLPFGARKDSDKQKTDTPSPFVSLVRELQECIPKEHQRSTKTDNALAGAISKARDSIADEKSS